MRTTINNLPGSLKLNRFKKLAFTLAEVLITMGIIGIVAEMTIPTLYTNIQLTTYNIKAKKAYSVCYQAIIKMKQDEGGTLSYYMTSDNTFKPVFMKYFIVTEDCGLQNCVPASYFSDMYASLYGDPANTAYGADGQFSTADGSFYNIQNLGSVHPEETVAIIVDVNGYKNKPNQLGVDTFTFQIINDNLVPMGAPNTTFPAPGYCNRTSPGARQGIGCAFYLLQGKSY